MNRFEYHIKKEYTPSKWEIGHLMTVQVPALTNSEIDSIWVTYTYMTKK
jgi:hypothetical protein